MASLGGGGGPYQRTNHTCELPLQDTLDFTLAPKKDFIYCAARQVPVLEGLLRQLTVPDLHHPDYYFLVNNGSTLPPPPLLPPSSTPPSGPAPYHGYGIDCRNFSFAGRYSFLPFFLFCVYLVDNNFKLFYKSKQI
jgi:hypothetical protein